MLFSAYKEDSYSDSHKNDIKLDIEEYSHMHMRLEEEK